ncbi:hypothetical protein AGMMS49587_13500 [Spirochaetia bacterium]|nr:hypothetical protein AGMMS49587_13500 [Spirochaetia bacterium]
MSGAQSRFASIILLVIMLFFSHALTVHAQTAGDGAGEIPAAPSEGVSGDAAAEASIINMDIRTSTLTELASWCRSLGLSEGGTRDELVKRLRDHFHVTAPADLAQEATNKKVITIESARSTEYFTLEEVDEEYARLRGDVIVSLKDGDALHRITAREILYNRTRNIITAAGGVQYIKESGETIETFRGDNITVNLDDWSSIFLDGVSERSLQSDETTYRFAGTVISRSNEDVTILTNAEITNASNPEAFWSLKAGKIWLLPGSDFAIRNAVLKVGEIPVLWFPFFYWPSDEIVFHPVLGMRSREGSFVQTTTYVLGRPTATATSESSLTQMMGNSSDMEKVREGIFLRSTGKKEMNPNETSLKVLVDLYANLGVYLGTELVLPKKGVLSSFQLSGGLGFTRDVKQVGGNYTPFTRYDGTSDWNKSRLFSWNAPFRFRLKTNGSLGWKYGSLSWAVPFYSDPYVDKDFLNRSEVMDWVSMIQGNSRKEEIDETTDTTILGTYEWRLNGAVTPPLPDKVRPYISTLSLSSFTSTMAFGRRSAKSIASKNYSPSREFFFPNKFTLYSMSVSIAGTPLTLGANKTTAEKDPPPEDDPFKNIGLPRSPWGEAAAEEAARAATGTVNLVPPVLGQRFDIKKTGGPRFSIDYRLTPSAASELQFRTGHLQEAEDVDWSKVSSILSTIQGDASTSFGLSHADGLYSNTFRLSGAGTWRDYTYINEDAEEVAGGKKTAFQNSGANAATYFSSSYDFSSTVKPLYRNAVWGNSSLQYSFKGLMAKSVFKNNKADSGLTMQDEPEWDIQYGSWDKDNLDSHQFITNLAANVRDKLQTFTLTADLPPKDPTLTGNATLRAWISETSLNMRVVNPADDDTRKMEPFRLTETLRFGTFGSLSQTMVLDPEIREYTNLTTSLTLWGFTTSYTAVRSVPYVFNYNNPDGSENGWRLNPNKIEILHPQELSFGYVQNFKKVEFWKKRLSFSFNVSTKMTFDLQRYTYSRLNFNLGFILGITKFLDLSFSATSENASIYRYFRNMPGFWLPISAEMGDGPQNNFFRDLFNSFRFGNDEARRLSGFKLKSLKFEATHHLGDWNAKLGMTVSPYLDRAPTTPVYKLNNEISFVVQWIPISEIKTEMAKDKGEWTFK